MEHTDQVYSELCLQQLFFYVLVIFKLLKFELDLVTRREQEEKDALVRRQQDELQFLKRNNQQLKAQVDAIMSARK